MSFHPSLTGSVGSALMQPTLPPLTPQIPTPTLPGQTPGGTGVPGAPNIDPGLWQKFLQKMQTDPNFQQALLTTGLNLLGGPQQGESGFGTFSRSALAGVNRLDALRARDRDEGRRQELLDIQKASVEDRAERTSAFDRRTVSTAASAERRAAASQKTAEERLALAKDSFAESKRQFNVRQRPGAAGSGITGTERLVNAGVEALVIAHPDAYPDTPEGRARARLVAQGVGAFEQDPLGQARVVASLMSDLARANQFADDPLSQEEIQEQALATFEVISGDLTQETIPEETDPFDGQSVTQDGQTGVIRKVGDDAYVVELPGGNTRRFSKAEIAAFVPGQQ